jgi:hypothetical protein
MGIVGTANTVKTQEKYSLLVSMRRSANDSYNWRTSFRHSRTPEHIVACAHTFLLHARQQNGAVGILANRNGRLLLLLILLIPRPNG